MNVSVEFFRVLIVLGDKDKTLATLFDMLDIETKKEVKEPTSGNIFPLFVVLKNLCAKAPEIRPYALARMFPGRDLEKEQEEDLKQDAKLRMDVPDKTAETVGNRIISMMTSFNQATQFTSNDLLFALVGEDTDLFIRLTGFGNAAGLLAMRGLFGMGGHLNRDTLSEFKAAQAEMEAEEAAKKAQEAIDRVPDDPSVQVQPRPKISIPELLPEVPGESEEDKEDRMVRNFEKMVEAGLVKLVHGDDKDKDKKTGEKK